jgi:hypothetical protein
LKFERLFDSLQDVLNYSSPSNNLEIAEFAFSVCSPEGVAGWLEHSRIGGGIGLCRP